MTTPKTFDQLLTVLAERRGKLPERLQQFAEFALTHPNDIAFETVATIARRAGVPPSALVRFGQALGFSGFSALQRLFRDRLVERVPSYADRLQAAGRLHGTAPAALLGHFVQAGIAALEHVQASNPPASLEQAVALLARAEQVLTVGQRRAFPLATYLAYALAKAGKPARLCDNLGGMLGLQIQGLKPRDLLLAVSFAPYARETLEAAALARAAGVPVLALTDQLGSPLAATASLALFVEDAQVEGVRALTASMCLATSLVVACGQRLGSRADGT